MYFNHDILKKCKKRDIVSRLISIHYHISRERSDYTPMSKDTKFLLGIKDPNIKKVRIISDSQKKGPLEAQAVLDYRPKPV